MKEILWILFNHAIFFEPQERNDGQEIKKNWEERFFSFFSLNYVICFEALGGLMVEKSKKLRGNTFRGFFSTMCYVLRPRED